MYTIIRKRQVFHALANLPSDVHGISKCLSNRKGLIGGQIRIANTSTKEQSHDRSLAQSTSSNRPKPFVRTEPAQSITEDEEYSDTDGKAEESMEGSWPAKPAEPGTLKVSLLDTPAIGQMTEKESAHPTKTVLSEFISSEPNVEEFGDFDDNVMNNETDDKVRILQLIRLLLF